MKGTHVGLKKNKKKSKMVSSVSDAPNKSRAAQVLDIVNSTKDAYVGLTDPPYYVMRCIHCNTTIAVTMRGETSGTIEHIMPIVAGGSRTDVANLALACKSCNNTKGVHHDSKNLSERAVEVITALLEKRRSQMK